MTDATQKDLDQDHATRLVKTAINEQAKLISKLAIAIEEHKDRIKSLEVENENVSRDIFALASHLINLSSYAQLKQGLVPLNTAPLDQIRAKRT